MIFPANDLTFSKNSLPNQPLGWFKLHKHKLQQSDNTEKLHND